MIDMTVDLYMQSLEHIGFIYAGIGAMGFFFINAFIIGSSVGVAAINPVYCEHTFRIKDYWLRDKEGNVEEYSHYPLEKDTPIDTSTWSKRKRFAFKAVDEGSELCFMLVCVGFILQFLYRFWVLFIQ